MDNDDAPHIQTPLDLDRITEMVNKLDAILKLLFDHFDRPPSTLSSPSEPSTPAPTPPPISPLPTSFPPLPPPSDPTPHLAQFHALLAIFTRTILCTFKSRYTQFLLFWFASRNTAFADLFLGELVAHALLEPSAPEVSRAAAASYVASFVSRAMFIGRDEARGTVRVLCRFLEHQVDVLEGADAAPAGVFYAVAQAVFLIFCFRWRELGEEGGLWMAELGVVQRVVACPLQPLKVIHHHFTLLSPTRNALMLRSILVLFGERGAPVRARGACHWVHVCLPVACDGPTATATECAAGAYHHEPEHAQRAHVVLPV